MKKIFTLTMGVLFATLLMAADRRPVVSISSSKNFKIVIDGRSYFGADMNINLSHLGYGRHTIKVFEIRRGYFQQRERMVSATSFFINRNDVRINIDWYGNIMIKEKKNRRPFWNDNRNDRIYDRDDDDRGRNGGNRRDDDDDDDRRF